MPAHSKHVLLDEELDAAFASRKRACAAIAAFISRNRPTRAYATRRKLRRYPQKYGEANSWQEWSDYLTEQEHKTRYKLTKAKFKEVADRLRPHLQKDERKQKQAAGPNGAVGVELRLALGAMAALYVRLGAELPCCVAGLRFMYGDTAISIADAYGVETDTVYKAKTAVVDALNAEYGQAYSNPITSIPYTASQCMAPSPSPHLNLTM